MEQFAVIQTGGKQVRVKPNQVIGIERLRLKEKQKEVVFDKVLFARKGESLQVGQPYVKGASVVCESLGEIKDVKKVIFKMRRRKNYRRKNGHRQILSQLRVKEIQYGS